MKIIKCGGSVLKCYENRKKLYNEIKSYDDKVILIVSAFLDCPYSTDNLQALLINNYDYYMRQELITLGEVISSIRVTNELLNEYIDASLIYKENIGIYVKTSDKMDEIVSLDSQFIQKELDNHKVIVVPGFIGINQENKIVSLNKNGSDLTTILIAKMLNINEVYLYKDVLGLSSIDPKINNNYKLYKNVSFSLMHQIIVHGSNLIQEEAIKQAKDNNINIIISHFNNHSYSTCVSKFSNEKVVVFQCDSNCIYIDGFNNKEIIENTLTTNNLLYDYILPCNSYLKIVTSFNNTTNIIDLLHKKYMKGEF